MNWNQHTQFDKLEDGVYSITHQSCHRQLVQKNGIFFYFFGVQKAYTSRFLANYDIIDVQPVEGFGPENSEYRGNSSSGQSRETDLIEKFHCEGDYSQMDILKKINSIINKINQSDKLVTITKEEPNLTNQEINNIIRLLKQQVNIANWQYVFDKLERLKV